jgi:hypothetical protein
VLDDVLLAGRGARPALLAGAGLQRTRLRTHGRPRTRGPVRAVPTVKEITTCSRRSSGVSPPFPRSPCATCFSTTDSPCRRRRSPLPRARRLRPRSTTAATSERSGCAGGGMPRHDRYQGPGDECPWCEPDRRPAFSRLAAGGDVSRGAAGAGDRRQRSQHCRSSCTARRHPSPRRAPCAARANTSASTVTAHPHAVQGSRAGAEEADRRRSEHRPGVAAVVAGPGRAGHGHDGVHDGRRPAARRSMRRPLGSKAMAPSATTLDRLEPRHRVSISASSRAKEVSGRSTTISPPADRVRAGSRPRPAREPAAAHRPR